MSESLKQTRARVRSGRTRLGAAREVAFAVLLVALVAAVSLFSGLPSTLSLGGGFIVLVFGSLWPIMWIASLLPHGALHSSRSISRSR